MIVSRICIRPVEGSVLLPGHHGYPRASDLIRDKALKGRKYIKITDATVETVSPSLQSNSQTSAGIFRSSSPLTSALHFDVSSMVQ